MKLTRRNAALGILSTTGLGLAFAKPAAAASAAALARDGRAALDNLYAAEPKTRILSENAREILVFPSIVKAGFIVGAQTGDGVLFRHGVAKKYYNISSASFGLQAGAESFSYALFFMTESSVAYLAKSYGWSIGTGPSVVVLDKGAAASITSTSLTQDVYAVPYGADGLMAGISLEGSKITLIHPGP